MSLFSGKPKRSKMEADQAPKDLSVAYGMKSRNKKIKNGPAGEDNKSDEKDLEPHKNIKRPSLEMGPKEDEYDSDEMAGGPSRSLADMVMNRRKARAMAEGGMVDLDANSEESPNMADSDNEEANGKELYDLPGDTSSDDNQIGDMIDENAHDMISQIRNKIKAKRGM